MCVPAVHIFKLKTHTGNAFQKRNVKLLLTVPNNTEAGKRVSATESLLLLKSQTIFQAQIAYFAQYILSKDNAFVRNITNRVLANNIRIASNFSTSYSSAIDNFSFSTMDYFTVELVAVARSYIVLIARKGSQISDGPSWTNLQSLQISLL